MFTRLCRPLWADCSSTISIVLDGSGRSTYRQKEPTGPMPKISANSSCEIIKAIRSRFPRSLISNGLGPEFTQRYNLYRCTQLNVTANPGFSSLQVMKALEDVFDSKMRKTMGYDYLGMSFQEKLAQKGVPAAAIFGLSLLFVFLILAAQYESWFLPVSVLICTPIAVFGAFLTLFGRELENNVYAQIGLVMLIGLAAKNAILIVEFARAERHKGRSLMDAALEGARLRLRPILMTSFAFILGCVPLWTAEGAGAVSRQIIGTAVIGGMLTASFIAIFLIPVFFYLVEKFSGGKDKAETEAPSVEGVSVQPDYNSARKQ